MNNDFIWGRIKEDAKIAFHNQWGVAVLITLFIGFFTLVNEALSAVENIAINTSLYKELLDSEVIDAIIKFYMKYDIFFLVVPLAISLFLIIAKYGECKLYLDIVESRDARFSTIFEGFLYVFKAVGASLYTTILIVLWSFLFFIPGLIAGIKYSMTTYIIAENPSIPITDAVDMSKNMMDGHKMDYFMLKLSFIPWVILITLTCGLASIYVTPYMNSAIAQFYVQVKSEYEVENGEE